MYTNKNAMLGLADIKTGKYIVLNNEPYLVTYNQFGKQARGTGTMKTKLKNLITGAVKEETFQGNDKVEEASISFRKAQFLYANGGEYDFMDQETFDQVSFTKAQLGDTALFLQDGMNIDIQYFNGNAINVQLPTKMTFTITETDPGVRGDTATGGTKPATLETGYVIKVPLFVNKGEKVVINTLTGEYVERAK